MADRTFTQKDILLARVLHEDADFITLEVPKSDTERLQVRDGDQFHTILFTAGKPWEE